MSTSEEKNKRLKTIQDKYAKIIKEMGEKEEEPGKLDNGTTRFKEVWKAYLKECEDVR